MFFQKVTAHEAKDRMTFAAALTVLGNFIPLNKLVDQDEPQYSATTLKTESGYHRKVEDAYKMAPITEKEYQSSTI